MNIRTSLEAAGAGLTDVVKVNAYPRDVDLHFHEYNEVYMDFFPTDRPTDRPTRTTVGAKIYGPILVEIDCIAYVPERRRRASTRSARAGARSSTRN